MRYLKRLSYSVFLLCASLFMVGSWNTNSVVTTSLSSEAYCYPERELVLASPYELLIVKYSLRAGVDHKILRAVIAHESGFNSQAINPNDPSYGLGQVMPKYWQRVFINQCGSEATPETLMDPETNICYAAYILRHFQDLYGPVAGIDAYNNGHGAPRGYSDAVLALTQDD